MEEIKFHLKKILKNRPLVCLTANNIYTAEILDDVCDIVLVGDSLGMVLYGENTTNKVTLDMMINHGRAVRKGIKKGGYTILNTKEKVKRIKELYEGSKSLNEIGFRVHVGNIVWNQCKKILSEDENDTRLIYY